jgi:hypothetical protein
MHPKAAPYSEDDGEEQADRLPQGGGHCRKASVTSTGRGPDARTASASEPDDPRADDYEVGWARESEYSAIASLMVCEREHAP